MKRDLMNQVVSDELDHIDQGEKGSDQNGLRLVYNMIRRRDLGRNPATPRAQSLQHAIEATRQSSPDFMPRYDQSYFRPGNAFRDEASA
jgi:hypothetical protein